ncbi:MAG: aldehyde dehydrogenase family protein [Myxococcota bacterium]
MSVAANSPLRPVPTTDVDTIPSVVASLRRSFDAGHTRPLEWRRQQLEQLRKMVAEHDQEFVDALAADFGKPDIEARAMDLGQVPTEVAIALKNLKKWTRPQRVGGMAFLGRSRIVREPLGVVLIIAPWNYPVGLLLSPLVGAIAAGNCAVLKPSEVTVHTSALLAKLVPQYLDPAAVAIVQGGVEETTALLDERWDHIFYTGGGRVGRVVMKAASEHLTPVTLELGGKSPCIVDADADLPVTARRIAWGKFLNAGQTCVAPDYVLVHESREQDLLRELKGAIQSFYGDDPMGSGDYARLVDARHHERVAKLMDGQEVAVGGRVDAERCMIEPTVLRNVAPDAPIMQEEIFGPVLPVLTVKSVEQAIDFVNERDKPLALYVFTKDEGAQQQVLDRTSSGGVCVNGTVMQLANPNLPFGGVGESGTGSYHGRHTFETFSNRKSVLVRGFRFDPSLMYPPYKSWKKKLMKKAF